MKRIVYAAIFVGTLLCSKFSFAIDLLGVYLQALQSDPVYKSSWENYLAATEAYPQARALLLPNIKLTGNVTYYHLRVYNSFSFVNTPFVAGGFNGPNNFLQGEYSLRLTQPIIDFAHWAHLGAAKEQVKQASANYAFATQDLMLRVATAYFNVLMAKDTLRYTLAQKRAFKKQLDQAEERYDVGLDAITSVYNARASYDLTVAQEISDSNSVENNLEKLRELTGIYYKKLAILKENFPFLPPNPINVESWVTAANAQNLNLKAALFTVDAARESIKQAFAGHFPVLNGFGNYDRIRPSNTNLGTPNDQFVSTAGVQLSLPIYQGGLITSQTQQARDNYLKSIADMEATERRTDASMRQTYNNIIALISKIQADRQSIISNESSVESTEAALTVGTRTIVDLLIVQQQLYKAEQTLAQDQYNYITQTLTLKELAGTLSAKDLAAINHWLSSVSLQKDYTDILVKKSTEPLKPETSRNPNINNSLVRKEK